MKGKRVVIVEDDFILLELHKHHVLNLGHFVVGCFTHADEALSYFKENTADIVLMDIRLEDSIDGIELMKQINVIRTIPVVYITGNTEDSNLARALDTQMKGFLSKPVSVDELDDIIDSINEINSSIVYAERIQKAIFPHKKEISRIFPDNIFINRPRNIISGDFCLIKKHHKTGEIIGGVGDCTGHGVPAALLSVLCHEILTDLTGKKSDLQSVIFSLNKNIIRNLSRLDQKNRVSDGLDLILFKVNKNNKEIVISGIQMPFVHYKKSNGTFEWHKLKGSAIGNPIDSPDSIPTITLQFEAGDYFFFFTDGNVDQFGGTNDKKLMKKGLLELLAQLFKKPSENPGVQLEINMRKWQGALPQTDDMLMFAFSPLNAKD